MSGPAASSLLRLLQEPVQNAVHEVRGLPGAEAAGEIHRFVDRDTVRDVGEQDLVGSEPQHVAVGDGHAPQAPILGAFGQHVVQLRTMVTHAGQQRSGKLDQHRVVVEALLEKPLRSRQAVARVHIIFEEDLQDDLSSSTASRHGS